MKFYHIAFILFIGLTIQNKAQASSDNLPYCPDTICEKIFHNKELNKATLIVWSGKGNILHSYSFDLDRSAKLSSKIKNGSPNISIAQNDPPSPPCQTGGCSTPISYTYETATEIVTITITYVYYNGQLVDVQPSESRRPKPDDEREIE